MFKKVNKVVILSNIIVILLCFLLFLTNTLQVLDHAVYDFDLIQSKSKQPHEDILVIAIDEKSLQQMGEPWPWHRERYGELVEAMNQPGYSAAAIAFDMLFVAETDAEQDALFADTLSRYNNVILPLYAETQDRFSYMTKVSRDQLVMARDVVKPIRVLEEVSEQAHINARIDSDGTIRRAWLRLNSPEGEIPAMAYKLVDMAGYDVSHYLDYNGMAEIAIKFDGTSYDFETVSFIDVLSGDFPYQNFQDRVVLVGYTAVGIDGQDSGAVPGESQMQLVYVHANIADQLMNNIYITIYSDILIIALFILLMFALALLLTWKLRTILGIVALFVVALSVFVGQYMLFKTANVYIVSVYAIAALFLTYLVNIAIKSFFENKQKAFITKQFGRYISPDLVKEIAASNEELQLGGINKDLSILFLDIRGFTTLSEQLKPEEVVDFLNEMFNLITEKTLENNGTIDKFIGDAAMIIFNAPLDVEDHAYYAVKTAYDIQQGMKQVRENILEKYNVEVSIGIGINTGHVVIGNIGSYLRMDYTAIGDNVNIAARIEANTVANQTLVSEETYLLTSEDVEYRYFGEVMMKGKTVPIKLYEVIEMKTLK